MQSIVVDQISKSYGSNGAVKALDGISFTVAKGELFGIIGPDGAGKTSLLRILATLILPDAGEAYLQDLHVVRDYKRLRSVLGYMPGRFSLYQDLSIQENLSFFAAVFDTSIEDNYDLIKDIYVQLEPFKDRRAGALSGGMKQKLALCCALIHKPEVLLLDEPGTGVDPVSRKEFWDMLKRLKSWGITILVSTPNMDEAELCDRVALLHKGKILAMDTPAGICASYTHPLLAVRSADMYRLIQDLRQWPGAYSCYAFGEYAHLALQQSLEGFDGKADNVMADLRLYLESLQHAAIEILHADPGVEDCFIASTQAH